MSRSRWSIVCVCCLLWIVPAALRGQSVSFVDAAGQPAGAYLESTRAWVRVVDPGANQNGGLAEAVTVALTTAVWSDQESLTLQETGPATGIFEGSIALRTAGPIAPGNGLLETGVAGGPPIHYDTLTAAYTDSAGTPQTATAATQGYRVELLDAAGNPVSSYLPGARVYVRLEDHNHNDPNRIDFNYVELTSSTGDDEPLGVYETGVDTGIYEGSIPLDLAAAIPSDDRLQAQVGGQISLDRWGPWFPAPVSAGIDAASVRFVDAAGRLAADLVAAGTARVQVDAPLANADPGAVETISVQLQSLQAGDQETVTLNETGPDTGRFEGGISMLYGAPASAGDGLLETAHSQQLVPDTITATYGAYSAVAPVVGARITFLGLRDQPMTEYSLRSLVRIQAEDHLDDTPGQVDVLYVTVSSPETGDAEAIPLTETGPDTGLFLGSLPSRETAGPSYDGVLWAGAGQTATVQYYGWAGPVSGQIPFTPNYVPVAGDDSLITDAGSPVTDNVLGNDSDAESSFQLAAVSQGAKGAVTFDSWGTVTYTPNPGTSGTDSFTYVIVDEQGGEALATVTVVVNAINHPPVAADDAVSVDEDGSVAIPVLANDNDPDGDPLQLAIDTPPANGTAQVNPDQTVSYTPAADFHGTDAFTYRIADSAGEAAFATVTVTVNSINDPPVANDDSAITGEDHPFAVIVIDNDTDADGDPLYVASVTQPAQGTVVINPDQTLLYTPAPNFYGLASFTYTVSDGNGGAATAAVTVYVLPQNDPPVANPDSATVAEDGSVNVAVLANDTDVENDVLTTTAVTQGAHGAVAINPDKTVKYTPAANYNGADSFTYTIADGHGGTATGTVTITVTAVNDAPVAVNDSATVAAGSAVTLPVLANDVDVDGPSLAVTGVTQGAHGTVAIGPDQAVTYTAALYIGGDTFTYTVSDGAGGTATATVNVAVTAPPRIASGLQARYNFNEGSGSAVNDTSGVGTPLNLTIASPSSVSWVSGGLSVNTATSIASPGAASKINSAAKAGNEITVEAWAKPASLTLTGPARILSLTKNSSQRNLVFGQTANRYETQASTSTGTPSLQSPSASLTSNLTHVVYTRASSGAATCYLNGVQVSTATASGTFSSWGTDHKLLMADNWQGTYYLVAVYGRALTGAEVQQNYLAGAEGN